MRSPKPSARKRRPRGRPASKKDKNGRPMTVRADRDGPMKWFFKDLPRQDLYERPHVCLHGTIPPSSAPPVQCNAI